MKIKLVGCIAAATLGAAIVVATPAVAFRGGGGFGGMHGAFSGGGMHFGGGGFAHGGMHFGGGFAHGGHFGMPNRGMVTDRSVFVRRGNRFVGAPFAGRRFFPNRFNHFSFRHHHFRNFFAFGVPFVVGAAYGDYCWRWIWSPYGWQWRNVCYDYGYGY